MGAPWVEIRHNPDGTCGIVAGAEPAALCDLYYSDEFCGNCKLRLGEARDENDYPVQPGPDCPGPGVYALVPLAGEQDDA